MSWRRAHGWQDGRAAFAEEARLVMPADESMMTSPGHAHYAPEEADTSACLLGISGRCQGGLLLAAE